MNSSIEAIGGKMSQSPAFENSYADFSLYRSYRQVKKAFGGRENVGKDMSDLHAQVVTSEERMVEKFGGPIENLDILEIGPGQGMERALYFGRKNTITTLDTDIIPFGFEPKNYYKMLRTNGPGRLAKTAGRELIIGRKNRSAWRNIINAKKVRRPKRIYGDICQSVPAVNAFDSVMSWSVFEHVPDPEKALDNVLASLRPGGFFYISLHLWTSNNGHHDIRAFTGSDAELPMWAHLRESTKSIPKPSSYLNEWRLPQWTELFERKTPGTTEILEQFEHPELYGPRLTGGLLEQLSDYTRDELLTVNAVYVGRKPA